MRRSSIHRAGASALVSCALLVGACSDRRDISVYVEAGTNGRTEDNEPDPAEDGSGGDEVETGGRSGGAPGSGSGKGGSPSASSGGSTSSSTGSGGSTGSGTGGAGSKGGAPATGNGGLTGTLGGGPPTTTTGGTPSTEPECGNGMREGDEECDDGNVEDDDGCSASCSFRCDSCACETCEASACTAFEDFDAEGLPATFDLVVDCYDNTELADDGPAAGAPKSELCAEIVACVRREGCDEVTCYCGDQSPEVCLQGTPMGPCKDVIEEGAESTSPPEVSERFVDPSYATGNAFRLVRCDVESCSSECL